MHALCRCRQEFADEFTAHSCCRFRPGSFATDTQPLARLNVSVIAKEGENIARGSSGGGGRVLLDFFLTDKTPEYFATESCAASGVATFGAVPAPAGEMPVVLGPGWPGVLLHEAVGHGLEADFNRKENIGLRGIDWPNGRQS